MAREQIAGPNNQGGSAEKHWPLSFSRFRLSVCLPVMRSPATVAGAPSVSQKKSPARVRARCATGRSRVAGDVPCPVARCHGLFRRDRVPIVALGRSCGVAHGGVRAVLGTEHDCNSVQWDDSILMRPQLATRRKEKLVLLFEAARRRLTRQTGDIAKLPNERIATATKELNQVTYDIREAQPPPEVSMPATQNEPTLLISTVGKILRWSKPFGSPHLRPAGCPGQNSARYRFG